MMRPSAVGNPARGPSRQTILTACFTVPVVVLAASFIWLAVDHGTIRLWGVVVHESGRYTLGETVLYLSHFLREVPTTVAYVLFMLGSSGAVRPTASGASAAAGAVARQLHRPAIGGSALVAAGVLVVGALLLTAAADGWSSALRDLFQYRTRDDLAGYGTHWRYHWLSTLWFGAVAGVAPTVLNRALRGPALHLHRHWAAAAWAYFAVMTLVFGLSADVFEDVRYAGHQAREIMTHGTVTLLFGVGVLLAVSRATEEAGRSVATRIPRWLVAAWATLAVVVPIYLAVVSLRGDVMAHGQPDLGLAAMVAAHYFEHTLDYILALLLLVGGLSRVNLRSRSGASIAFPSRPNRSHARS